MPVEADPAGALAAAEDATARGALREAIDLLTAANRERPDEAIESRLVVLRHQAAVADVRAAEGGGASPHGSPIPDDDPFGPPGIPEIAGEDLNAEVLGAALAHRGSLIVRGLLDRATADQLRDDVAAAEAAALRWADGDPVDRTRPWFVPFEPVEPFALGVVERWVATTGGGVLAVDSPRALFHLIEAYHRLGIGELLQEYLGEWPAISAKKSTLRHATPTAPKGWHQDGAFLGTGTRTVNIWTALSACGVDAPGVDMFRRPFDHIVETGTGSALFDWSVSEEHATSLGSDDIERPVFEPGDALLFDQMSLHCTAVSPSMTKDRYAIESWFFAPSTYPLAQIPIAF